METTKIVKRKFGAFILFLPKNFFNFYNLSAFRPFFGATIVNVEGCTRGNSSVKLIF